MHLGLNLLFLIPGETGGRETYARQLIAALFRLEPGLRATAFVNREITAAERRDLGATMRVIGLPASPRSPVSWAIGELALLPVAADRAGVEVLHSLANFGPGTGRSRRVLTLHDLQYRALPELMSPARRLATGALIGIAARRASRIITVSAAAGEEVRALTRLDPRRLAVVPNGVAPPSVPATAQVEALRARLHVSDRPVVLTVASNLPHKNLPFVVETLRRIAPSRRPIAVIAGYGTDDPALRASAERAGVAENVRLLGAVPQDELETLYALADALLLPTRYEGFGLPVLEAMVRGVPVVCSDIPPLREITGEAALCFDPDRAEDAAAALARLLADPELRTRLATAGRERGESYSWAAAAQATLGVYREALAPD